MKTKSTKTETATASPERESELKRAEDQARAQFESIKEMVAALDAAQEAGDDDAREQAEQTIHEDALTVEVRSNWHSPGDTSGTYDEEFRILLCTGGPACHIVGELGEGNEPEKATIQYQDWFTPWTDYRLTSDEEEIVLKYCRCFYFGE